MPTACRRRAVAPTLTALAFAIFSTAVTYGQTEAESLSSSFRKAAKRVLPAVVTVRPLGMAAPNPARGVPPGGPFGPGMRGFPPEMPPEGGGSGVVIDADKGYVLTNDHVVQGDSRVVVILNDGRERSVSQVRRDPKSDLALLIVDGKGLTAAEWGDSEALDVGDWVLAVGQPFGLSDTVTAGIVSGKGRGIGVAMYEDLLQTDAAINPGNSGGPLVNLKGQVVGINAAIKSLRGGYEGVGFAIPATRARRVVADLAEHGRVRRAYLGIQIGPVDRETAERLDQPGAVVVNGVAPDSPASDAGLVRGDVILSLEGKPVAGPSSLQAAIEFAPLDRPLALSFSRDGERKEATVRPKPQPEAFGLPETEPPQFPGGRRFPGAPPAPRPVEPPLLEEPQDREPRNPQETQFRSADVRFPMLGLRLSEPTPELARRHRLERPAHGLVIVGVDRDGPADRGGLEPGMIITEVGRRKVESLDDFRDALASRRPVGGDLVVRILKGPKAEFRVIPLRAEPGTGDAPQPKQPSSSR